MNLQMIEYAENELKLTGFDQSAFGKTALLYLNQLNEMAKGDPFLSKQLHDMIGTLINKEPISPLYEDELVEIEVYNPTDKGLEPIKRKQHPRCPYVYEENGKFFDDRGIGFQQADGSRWYGTNGPYVSKIEITFPYLRKEKTIFVN